MTANETVLAYIENLHFRYLERALADARAGDKKAMSYLRRAYRNAHPAPDTSYAAEARAERMAEYAAESAESWAYADNN